jgi:hypothetical protein
MTFDPTGAATSGLVERVKNILLTPQAEWERIDAEPADVNKIYMGYVLPLAALSAICAFIGMSVFGLNLMGTTYRVGLVPGAVGALIQVAAGVGGVFLMAFIANALAPTFGSQQNMGQAHKLAAYGSTAGFLAGVFSIFPPLAMLGIVGLYSLYLIYVGLPKMMKTPEDKRIAYFLSVIVVAIIAGVILSVVLGSVRGLLGAGVTPGFG